VSSEENDKDDADESPDIVDNSCKRKKEPSRPESLREGTEGC
jgi:hypothetical protein